MCLGCPGLFTNILISSSGQLRQKYKTKQNKQISSFQYFTCPYLLKSLKTLGYIRFSKSLHDSSGLQVNWLEWHFLGLLLSTETLLQPCQNTIVVTDYRIWNKTVGEKFCERKTFFVFKSLQSKQYLKITEKYWRGWILIMKVSMKVSTFLLKWISGSI